MSIVVRCECGRWLKADDSFRGSRAECPACRRAVVLEPALMTESIEIFGFPQPPLEVTYFPDAVGAPSATSPVSSATEPDEPVRKPIARRMLESLLDPRAIHWMLLIGGGLSVLGLIVWLVSIGVFDDPRHVAVALGAGSLAILAGGWATALKTRYRLAGQALTFLGCVVTPLNLWFYHSQDLISIDQHLWIGGLICVALYAATVRALRDPLFMYAVEAGITLTSLLLLADLQLIHDTGHLALFLISLGAISIHAERAFPTSGSFDRTRFGMPLYWAGHAQLGTGLALLLASQVFGWLATPLGIFWPGDFVTQSSLLAGGLWIAGIWLYLYSDIVVTRKGSYSWLAAVCLVLAELTLSADFVDAGGFIAVTAFTALLLQWIRQMLSTQSELFRMRLSTIAVALSVLPVALGALLYVRGSSVIAEAVGLEASTDVWFSVAMLFAAVCNITSAALCGSAHPKSSAGHHYLGAMSLLIAAASALRVVGVTQWSLAAAVLMALPLIYIVAARSFRGRSFEATLARAAHGLTLVILAGAGVASTRIGSHEFFIPAEGASVTLHVAVLFGAASVFYALAGLFRRRGWNAYLGTVTACASLWHVLGFAGTAVEHYPLTYALLGLFGLILGRVLGVAPQVSAGADGHLSSSRPGRGRTVFQCGAAVSTLALLVATFQGLGHIGRSLEWGDLASLAPILSLSFAAVWIAPAGDWRRWYAFWTTALFGVGLLMFSQLSELTGWQKLEVFSTVAGLVVLTAGHIGLFGENGKREDSVSMSLWMGSLLAAVPLFFAMCHHRFSADAPSLWDELALLTVSTAMLVTGCGWRIKSTTILGGSALLAYLVILVASVAYRPEVAVGVYLLVGGAVIFAVGVLLSIYRERLMQLPDLIARRDGIFRIIGWR